MREGGVVRYLGLEWIGQVWGREEINDEAHRRGGDGGVRIW